MDKELYEKYGCGATDDITFCFADCNEKRCFRNSIYIKDKTIPHSFALFDGDENYCFKMRLKHEA